MTSKSSIGTAPDARFGRKPETAGSLADELFAKIASRIQAGELVPGDRLPTQKEIAESENVSRTVVREAVAKLAVQGWTTSRQGSGVYVDDAAAFRAFQIDRDELNELADVIRLLEMRLGIETEMAGLAAARRTTQDIGRIQMALNEIGRVSADAAAAAKADSAFHLAIARATQNDYYVRFIDFLGIRLVPPRSLYLRDEPAEAHDAYSAKVKAEHEAIIDAIVRMDSAAARDAARRHMQESLTRHSMLSAAARLREAGQSSDC